MPLPNVVRATVGLVALTGDEIRRLPRRVLELPMLAVSAVLQQSLRSQQRYARLIARGDEVLNHLHTSDEAPAWATFDEPVDEVDLTQAADHANGSRVAPPPGRPKTRAKKVAAPRHAPPSAFDAVGDRHEPSGE
jgi:hypothetical protein